jgi:hypothetical protein
MGDVRHYAPGSVQRGRDPIEFVVSRRTFVKGGAIALLSTGLPWAWRVRQAGARLAPVAPEVGAAPLDALTREGFARHLRATFRIHTGRRRLAARLVAADDRGSAAHGTTACFVLRFRVGRRRAPLTQGTYEIAHGRLGRFPLFLVPMGDDEHGRYYEAIVNRLPV